MTGKVHNGHSINESIFDIGLSGSQHLNSKIAAKFLLNKQKSTSLIISINF